MMGSTEAVKTEATNQPKKKGPKREKSRAQKDAHNANCRKSRMKLKRKREELTEDYTMIRDENQRMKKELEEKNFKLQCMENSNQELQRALEKQAAKEEWMRLIPTRWNVDGQKFGSFDESVEWFAFQSNMEVGQVSGTRIFQDFNELEGLGMTGTDNFLPSDADFYQQIGFDLDYSNITACAAGPSSVANHAWPCVFDAPKNDGVLNNSAVGSSFDANQDLPVFGVPNNHDNLFTHNPATGFLTPSAAAGFSFAANQDLPTVFDASNNSDLFTTHHNPDAVYK